MGEKYFPGFQFKEFKEPEPFEIITTSSDDSGLIFETESTESGQSILDTEDTITDLEPEPWNPIQIQGEFLTYLNQISDEIISPKLTMKRRTIKFVTPDQMRPKTETHRKRLVQRYGKDLEGGGVGDCKRNQDGTFLIRIGYAGQEEVETKEDVMSTMAHEYGHTLGNRLRNPIFEELKAYTFSNLFMRYFYDVQEYIAFQMEICGTHDIAKFWLEQLLCKGISEEAILSHLTGKRFGRAYPKDYMRYCS